MTSDTGAGDMIVYLGNPYPAEDFEYQFNPRLTVDYADEIGPSAG